MVGFIYGRRGTGKSEFVYSRMEDAAKVGKVYLLVPDREAVMAESRVAELSGAGNMDVITFGRLCNYIFRAFGGLCADYIGKGAKKLVMRNVLKSLSPVLKEYGTAGGFGLYEKLTMARTVMYRDKITPRLLDDAARDLGYTSALGAKTSDLSVIFSAYDAEITSRWEDPDGVLARAEKLLTEHDFFTGCTVFIDAFDSFSVQQYDILYHMMREAENIYITLPYLPEDEKDASVQGLLETERALRKTADRAGILETPAIFLRTPKRYASEELSFLATEIAGGHTVRSTYDKKPQDITLLRAANIFAEAEAAALDICKKIRAGARYREMAVIVRDTSSYAGVLDAVFRKYDIPYFLSSRKDISEKPLIKTIFSALSVCERGFRGQDVISYVKTGYADLSMDEACLFENYIVKWNIRGKMFTGDEPWSMHPRGYGVALTAEDEKDLVRLADIRNRIIAPLKNLAAANREARTVRDRATLIYDFLSAMGVPERLSADAEEARERGDLALAAETVQLWNAFCASLDELVVACGETEAPVLEFSQMLSMILMETDIGKIPTSVDEVTISSALQTLPGKHRFVYLLGACEGVFPQKISEDGLFSEYEKARLETVGVSFIDRLQKRVCEELAYFYRAATLPSEKLYISFPHYSMSGAEQKPSMGIKRIQKLFPAAEMLEFELFEAQELLESKKASFEHALSMGGNLGRALKEYYAEDADYAEKMRYVKTPLSAKNEKLSPACADELFGGKLKTSYTRLEKYIRCRFAYFCEYELALRDQMPTSFGAVDIGSFMHGVLEKTVQWLASGAESDIEATVRDIAKQYILSVFRLSEETVPRRLRHLFDYLCRYAVRFAEQMKTEFDETDFRPLDFELTVGGGGDAVSPMTLSADGVSVDLRGKIDRVDAFEGEGGKLYLRVVDYKTGEKAFDLENVKLGLDMQMLLYLFSLWENGERRYGREIIPAGVMYAGIKPSCIDLQIGDEAGEGEITVKRSGLFLHDEVILRAMDPELAGKWIPIKKRDLEKGKANLLGLDAFLQMKKDVSETVLRYAAELKDGVAFAKPLSVSGKSPCEYCKMRAICRT